MANTPEGTVKHAVKKFLTAYTCYSFWPVQTGMGSRTLDCLGSYRGQAFAIETKAPGKKPTDQQAMIIRGMERGGMKVFVIDTDDRATDCWEAMHSWFIAASCDDLI